MKIIITENKMLDVFKKTSFKHWNKIGYAVTDRTFMKLMNMPMSLYDASLDWVKEWNQEHNINPLKYLEDDGYKFHQSEISPHDYVCDESRTLHITEDSISSDVYIHRVNVNTKDSTLDVWYEIDFDTLSDNGQTLNDLFPHSDEELEDDEEYFGTIQDYRDEIYRGVAQHFYRNYADKMGYNLEVEDS